MSLRPAILIALALFVAPSALAQLSADDFITPAAATTPEAREKARALDDPGAVEQTTDEATAAPVIKAASQQDAVNAGLRELNGPGCQMIMGPNGRAWVATGQAAYREMENINATRLSKREAYVVAHMNAKRELARTLRGMSNTGKSAVASEFAALDTPDKTLVNTTDLSSEQIEQVVESVLRGYVVYDVNDDAQQKVVRVSIVTSPFTRGQVQRPRPDGLEAKSLRDGINHVFTEINSGIVPPVGGRVISVPATGELAFIGFGSAIVRSDANAAVQSKLQLTAQRMAQARAQDALTGIIIGDHVAGSEAIASEVESGIQDFEKIESDDPLSEHAQDSVNPFEKRVETFQATESENSEIKSLRKGVLPPGISMKTFADADNAWVYAVAVYTPGISKAAGEDAEAMDNAQIVQPAGSKAGGATGSSKGSGFTDRDNAAVARPSQDVAPGPSGQVSTEF
jgi:hypothetical protein